MVSAGRFGPLTPTHPLVVGIPETGIEPKGCPACEQPFEAGDYVTLLGMGPGADPEARERAREGRPYTGPALPIHWACATGEEA